MPEKDEHKSQDERCRLCQYQRGEHQSLLHLGDHGKKRPEPDPCKYRHHKSLGVFVLMAAGRARHEPDAEDGDDEAKYVPYIGNTEEK